MPVADKILEGFRCGPTLMKRWKQMDLADASIVTLSELQVQCQVLTVDRKDFSVYRRNDRQAIDFVAPPAGRRP